jgi:hypothetical protein
MAVCYVHDPVEMAVLLVIIHVSKIRTFFLLMKFSISVFNANCLYI